MSTRRRVPERPLVEYVGAAVGGPADGETFSAPSVVCAWVDHDDEDLTPHFYAFEEDHVVEGRVDVHHGTWHPVEVVNG